MVKNRTYFQEELLCLHRKLQRLDSETQKKLRHLELFGGQLLLEQCCEDTLRRDIDIGWRKIVALQKQREYQEKKACYLRSNQRNHIAKLNDSQERSSVQIETTNAEKKRIHSRGRNRKDILNQFLCGARIEYHDFCEKFESWRIAWPHCHVLLEIEPKIARTMNYASILQGIVGEWKSLVDVTFTLQKLSFANPEKDQVRRPITFDAPVSDFRDALAAQISVLLHDIRFLEEKVISMKAVRKKLRIFMAEVIYGIDNDLQSFEVLICPHKMHKVDHDDMAKSQGKNCLEASIKSKVSTFSPKMCNKVGRGRNKTYCDVASTQLFHHMMNFIRHLLCKNYFCMEFSDQISELGTQYKTNDNDIYGACASMSLESLEELRQSKLIIYSIYKSGKFMARHVSFSLSNSFQHTSCIEYDSSTVNYRLEWLKYKLDRTQTYLALETFIGEEVWTINAAGEITTLLQKLKREYLNISSDDSYRTVVILDNTKGAEGTVAFNADFCRSNLKMASSMETRHNIVSFNDIVDYFSYKDKKIEKRGVDEGCMETVDRKKIRSVIAAGMKAQRKLNRVNLDNFYKSNENVQVDRDYPQIVRSWVTSRDHHLKLPSAMLEDENEGLNDNGDAVQVTNENVTEIYSNHSIISINEPVKQSNARFSSSLHNCSGSRQLNLVSHDRANDLHEKIPQILLLERDALVGFADIFLPVQTEVAKVRLCFNKGTRTTSLLMNFKYREEGDPCKYFFMVIPAEELDEIFEDTVDTEQICLNNDSLFQELIARLRIERFYSAKAYQLALNALQNGYLHKGGETAPLPTMKAYEASLTVLTLRTKVNGDLRSVSIGMSQNFVRIDGGIFRN